MEFIIKSKNMELDDRIRNYAEKKIKNKIVKILDNVIKVEVKFIYEKNPRISLDNKVEVTVFTPGSTIRATDSGSDVYEAIDKVNSKLERLMKKYKEKLVSRGRKGEGRKEFAEIGEDIGSVKDDS
ncbi:MAG: ribosome-associated translation inhibitor RaiA, partial [Actinomycetota bacterium]|nr:ribosome-associated translation inhibitor RaiA [Actinomycetota bacterium]